VRGRGAIEEAGLGSDGNHFAGTLSKAFGALGGIVPTSAALAAKIKENAMIMRGASPPPPAAVGAAVAALRVLETTPAMRANLKRNVKLVRQGLRELGFTIPDSPVPIVSVQDAVDLDRIRNGLYERDIVVKVAAASSYSDAPVVPAMRLAIFSEHTPEQIDRLLSSIRDFL
jgi:glycine C-acetyltransferase/8-amino-7-oxononanoate synthase